MESIPKIPRKPLKSDADLNGQNYLDDNSIDKLNGNGTIEVAGQKRKTEEDIDETSKISSSAAKRTKVENDNDNDNEIVVLEDDETIEID